MVLCLLGRKLALQRGLSQTLIGCAHAIRSPPSRTARATLSPRHAAPRGHPGRWAMLIGAHVSPAGGLAKAIERGSERGGRAIQIFNQSPRMWRPTAYTEEAFAAFREAMDASTIGAVLIHAVYLLTCASEDPDIRAKALASLTHSLRVGHAIGAAGVVLHPGSAKTGDVGEAIARAGETIGEALRESEGCELH